MRLFLAPSAAGDALRVLKLLRLAKLIKLYKVIKREHYGDQARSPSPPRSRNRLRSMAVVGVAECNAAECTPLSACYGRWMHGTACARTL